MKIFSSIYQKMLVWARHKHAPKYLAITSIAESSFFPMPVDIMLAPMVLAKPNRWWRLALLTTIMSTVGGIIGYAIGYFSLELASPILQKYNYWDSFLKVHLWFHQWGIWLILVLSFSPIPYKIATIAAGGFGIPLIPFILISLIGRGARFFLVAYLVKVSAKKINTLNLVWIERAGWATVFLLLLAIGIKWLN